MLTAQPNVGLPSRLGGRIVYPNATPDYFAEFAAQARRLGARGIAGSEAGAGHGAVRSFVVEPFKIPSGSMILGTKGIADAYRTGRGSITMRAVVNVEEIQGRTCLVVTELPYMANPDNLAVKIAELPETKEAYDRWLRLLDGEPVFHNLDVVEQVGGPEGIPSVGLTAWPTPGGG